MIIDTHCHYNLEPLYGGGNGWHAHWHKAQEVGVTKSIVIGTDFFSSNAAIGIAEQDQNLWATVGCHPHVYFDTVKETLQRNGTMDDMMGDLETDMFELGLIADNQRVVGIGETGLDYFYLSQTDELDLTAKQMVKDLQQEAFRLHVTLARQKNLPLIIHTRDKGEEAYWDVLNILKELDFQGKFILHCVSGPKEYVEQAMRLGGYIGVAGNVTYKNADHIRELVKSVPIERVLLETDAPYLPPQEFRGKMCEPWMISKTAEFVEKELGIPLTKILENTQTVFPQLHQ